MRRENRRSSPLRRAEDTGIDELSPAGIPATTTVAAGRARLIAVVERVVLARDLDRCVDPTPTGRAQQNVALAATVHHGRDRAQAPCRGHAVRQPVRCHDRRGAGGARQLDQQQPDGPAAEDTDRVAGPHSGQAEGVDRDAKRLEHGTRRIVDPVRQRHEVRRRPRASRASPRRLWSGPGIRTRGHKWPSPAAHVSQAPQGICGSSATRAPARGPSTMTPAASWPRISGRVSTASPIADTSYQCRSEPQMPTAVTRTSAPLPGLGSGSARRRAAGRPVRGGGVPSSSSLVSGDEERPLRLAVPAPVQDRCRDRGEARRQVREPNHA